MLVGLNIHNKKSNISFSISWSVPLYTRYLWLFIECFNGACINTDSYIADHAIVYILAVCRDDGDNWVVSSRSVLGENRVISVSGAVDLRMGGVRL